MIRDKLILAGAAGVAGGIIKAVIIQIAFYLGFSKVTLTSFAASLFLPAGLLTTAGGTVVGLVTHLLCSILFFLPFSYALEITGPDYHFSKGLGFGGAVWLVNIGLIAYFTPCLSLVRTDTGTLLSFLVGHLAYGITAAFIAVTYGYRVPADK